jgi:hypothetical protein
MTDVLEALKSVQFVFDVQGKQTGALLSLSAWQALLDWLEEQEDTAVVRQAITELKAAGGRPKQAKWVAWESVKDEWDEG